eukprot:TRINITY_DN2099_c0_g1_i1.p1 TRINITY_DN2099_c0_g1~~TRINITY_DN2099_c0_g1_i1.p1  ORF type:complete len:1033 (+),score=163.03 TRINITY_DN2099_c0_g1_i1:56-3154(+)
MEGVLRVCFLLCALVHGTEGQGYGYFQIITNGYCVGAAGTETALASHANKDDCRKECSETYQRAVNPFWCPAARYNTVTGECIALKSGCKDPYIAQNNYILYLASCGEHYRANDPSVGSTSSTTACDCSQKCDADPACKFWNLEHATTTCYFYDTTVNGAYVLDGWDYGSGGCEGCQFPTPAPPTDAPDTNPPDTAAPTTAPDTNAPDTDAPDTDAPNTDAPDTDAPDTDAPNTDAPDTDAPDTDAPNTDAPDTDAPDTDAPNTDAPNTDTPDTDAPDTTPPDTPSPNTPAPVTLAPKSDAPATPAPDTAAPDTSVPATSSPDTDAPMTPAPDTAAPHTAVPTSAPVTPKPLTTAPDTAVPTSAPDTLSPKTSPPDTLAPDTPKPDTAIPTAVPATPAPDTNAPNTAVPTSAPDTPAPLSLAPDTAVPTAAPATPAPDTSSPDTAEPTATPTVAPPTTAPLFPPTAQPTASPTTAPATAVPTTSPATVTPTVVPTTSPATATPTAGPTAFPATAAPTAVPTDAPNTTPPTAVPTSPPFTSAPDTPAPSTTVPDTAAPDTLVPTAVPTSAPDTPVPPVMEEKRLVAGSGVATGVGGAAIMTMSVGAALGAQRLLLAMGTGCGMSDEDNDVLPFNLHPTGWSLGSGGIYIGCITGNIAIIAGVSLLHFIAVNLLSVVYKGASDAMEAQGLLRFPAATMFCFFFLLQGISLSGARVFFHPKEWWHGLVGAMTLVVCTFVMVAVFWFFRNIENKAVYYKDSKTGKVAAYFVGDGEWLPLKHSFVDRFGVGFRRYLPHAARFVTVDCALSLGMALAAAVQVKTMKECGHKRIAMACMTIVYGITIALKRPYAHQRNNHTELVGQSLQTIGLILIAAGFYSEDRTSACFTAGMYAILVAMVCLLIRTLGDGAVLLWVVISGRIPRLLKEREILRDDMLENHETESLKSLDPKDERELTTSEEGHDWNGLLRDVGQDANPNKSLTWDELLLDTTPSQSTQPPLNTRSSSNNLIPPRRRLNQQKGTSPLSHSSLPSSFSV